MECLLSRLNGGRYKNTSHWVAYKQQKFISQSPGAGKCKIKVPADLTPGKSSLPNS